MVVSKEYPLYFPNPGWSEKKPEDWYEQSIVGLRELLDTGQVSGSRNGRQLPANQRLTKYGKFIRKLSLNELGNFFNIIKGEMSIIGPMDRSTAVKSRVSIDDFECNCYINIIININTIFLKI